LSSRAAVKEAKAGHKNTATFATNVKFI